MATATHSTRSDLRADAGVAALVFVLSLGLLAASGSDLGERRGDFDALGVLLTALSTLPLIARRRAPISVFVLTALASAVLHAVAEPAGPPLGPTVALFFLAAVDQPRARARLILAVAAVLLVVHATVVWLAGSTSPGTAIAFGVLVWGGAWLAGDRARLRRERMAELEQRALRAEREAERERRLAAAEERARIARDLHDSAGHAINVILVHAGLGRLRATQDAEARERFQTIEDVARQTVTDIDQLVKALREDGSQPEVEPPPGLASLDTLLERHRAAGLEVEASVRGDRDALTPSVDRGAYRILQEALTNTARHGNGSAQVDIEIGRGALDVTVANPVRPGAAPRDSGGHGLVGMRERAALLGGSLDTTVGDGRFRLHARLPVAGRPA